MANPPLRTDFTDSKTPGPNQLSAAEYNRNAQRTDEAWQYKKAGTATGEAVRTGDAAAGRAALDAAPADAGNPIAGEPVQPRRGTAAEWAAANPILAEGEEGLETDTGQSKRGDGVTAWAALPYVGKWDSIPGKPAYVAEGETQADARLAVDALGRTVLRVQTRTNEVKDPDYDFPTAWVNSFTTGTPTVSQQTYTFSDGTTRKGAQVLFAANQGSVGGAIRVGRTTYDDITIPSNSPVAVQVRVVSSIAQRLYVAAVELAPTGGIVLYYTWSDILDVPAGGDGVLFTVKIPQTQATASRMQIQVWPTRGVPFTAGSWLFVTGATVERSSKPLGPIFSGNDADASWEGVAGQSKSITQMSNPVKDSVAPTLYGTPAVNQEAISTLRDGLPAYLTENAWEPPRTRWGPPRRPWLREAPSEGWPTGCLAHDGEYIYHGYHDLQRLDPAPRGMRARVRRQRIGAPSPQAAVTIWDNVSEGLDADINALVVAPNGDICAILREGSDTFPIPAPTITGNYLVRSTDQGATWDAGTAVLDDAAAPIKVTSFAAPFVTEAGTTLATGINNVFGATYILVLRNTTPDLAGGWARIAIPNIPANQTLIEGAFVQFKGGLIGLVLRAIDNTTFAFTTYSTDDGLTWAPGVISNLVLNNNPATIIYNPSNDTAEIICGDRSKAWIMGTLATADDFISATFGTPTKIVDTFSTPGATGLGYPAAIRLPDNRRLLRYMDLDIPGNTSQISIWESWGRSI